MKTIRSFMYFVPLLVLVGVLAFAADQDVVTVHTMNGTDTTNLKRCYPVYSALVDGCPTGRFLIPGASASFYSTPIDVRGMSTLVLQRSISTIKDTTGNVCSMKLYGTPVAMDFDDIISSTAMYDDDASGLPMRFPDVTRGAFWTNTAGTTKYFYAEKSVITSVTSGFHVVDVKGIAWVSFCIAAKAKTGTAATENVFYYAEK